jgi:endonuclease-3
MKTQAEILTVLRLLNKAYGRLRPFRRTDPVDEIVRTILSQNTNDKNSLAAFADLKRAFRSWESLLRAKEAKIAAAIRHAGLSKIKAARIKGVLAEIMVREGRLSLARLGRMRPEDALEYLRSLEGIGPKTAACVLLFSFGMPVMPVDTHIFRVSKRLGLIDAKTGIEEAHGTLSRLVPKRLIYSFHLGIIEHGRKTCKALHPVCGACVLYGLCKSRGRA